MHKILQKTQFNMNMNKKIVNKKTFSGSLKLKKQTKIRIFE